MKLIFSKLWILHYFPSCLQVICLISYTRNFPGIYQYFSWANPFFHFENEDIFFPVASILIHTSSILHLSEFCKEETKEFSTSGRLCIWASIYRTQGWFKRPALLKRRLIYLIYYHDNPNKMKLLKLPCIGGQFFKWRSMLIEISSFFPQLLTKFLS